MLLYNQYIYGAFICFSGFVRLNTQSKEKTTLTTTLDTSAIDMASTFKLQMAFVKFHKHSVSYDFNLDVEGGVSLTGNTRDLSAKTTATTDLFDISWILDQWKEQGNHAKLTVQFNITKSARKQPKSLVLKTWQKFVRDKTWQQYGPVFLVAYFKDVSKLTMPLSGNSGPRLRSGSTTQCKLHSFQATFAELGLSDVFVKPTGAIDFSVCYGQCDASGSVDSRVGHMTTHAWVLELARRVLPNPTVPKNHLQSSCVPTAYQGVRVLKKETNGNLVYQVIQDLTASACGCR